MVDEMLLLLLCDKKSFLPLYQCMSKFLFFVKQFLHCISVCDISCKVLNIQYICVSMKWMGGQRHETYKNGRKYIEHPTRARQTNSKNNNSAGRSACLLTIGVFSSSMYNRLRRTNNNNNIPTYNQFRFLWQFIAAPPRQKSLPTNSVNNNTANIYSWACVSWTCVCACV